MASHKFPVGTFSRAGSGNWRCGEPLPDAGLLATGHGLLEARVVMQRIEVRVDLQPGGREVVSSTAQGHMNSGEPERTATFQLR